jgi:hypothetical protein
MATGHCYWNNVIFAGNEYNLSTGHQVLLVVTSLCAGGNETVISSLSNARDSKKV